MIKPLFSLLAFILTLYSFILFARIVLSWITLRGTNSAIANSRIVQYIYKITDPYLNWFRRFKFMQIGFVDFSSILGIVTVYFFTQIFSSIAATGTLSPVVLVALLLSNIWSIFSSILFITIIFLIIRILFIQFNKYSQIFYNLDGYIEPAVRKFSNKITKKFTSYKTNLLILLGTLIVAYIGGRVLIVFLIDLLRKTATI